MNSRFTGCQIIDCDVFGANIWSLDSIETVQKDLKVPYGENKIKKSFISIDDIELANVVYLLSMNANFSKLIDQSKTNCVLILGRFSDGAIDRLHQIKEELRIRNFSPIVFDFKSPKSLDLIEVIVLLSLLSKFIIADLSEPKSVPAELQAILGSLMIPVVPILQRNSTPYGTFTSTNRYFWVLPVLIFDTTDDLKRVFDKAIVEPGIELFKKVVEIKNMETNFRDASKL